jgi:hypothetical protein
MDLDRRSLETPDISRTTSSLLSSGSGTSAASSTRRIPSRRRPRAWWTRRERAPSPCSVTCRIQPRTLSVRARRRSYGLGSGETGKHPVRAAQAGRGPTTKQGSKPSHTVHGASERVARARACHDARAAATQRGARTYACRGRLMSTLAVAATNDRSESASRRALPVGSGSTTRRRVNF